MKALILLLLLTASTITVAQTCKPKIPEYRDTAVVTTFFSGIEKIRIPYDFNKDSVKIGMILMCPDSITSVTNRLLAGAGDFSKSEFSILYCDKYIACGDTIKKDDIVGLETLMKQNEQHYFHKLFVRTNGAFEENKYFNCQTPVLINFSAIDYFSANYIKFSRNPKHHTIIFLFDPNYKTIKKPSKDSELSDRIKGKVK